MEKTTLIHPIRWGICFYFLLIFTFSCRIEKASTPDDISKDDVVEKYWVESESLKNMYQLFTSRMASKYECSEIDYLTIGINMSVSPAEYSLQCAAKPLAFTAGSDFVVISLDSSVVFQSSEKVFEQFIKKKEIVKHEFLSVNKLEKALFNKCLDRNNFSVYYMSFEVDDNQVSPGELIEIIDN